MSQQLPQHVRPLAAGESFTFTCRPDVECFTNCCRDLELALTPYDVLRLKHKLRMTSADFLDRFVILEQDSHETFPRLYLTMVDDGKASCPFITENGCRVYDSRPGACRAYPLGRGVSLDDSGARGERYVLLTEPHCLGFDTTVHFTAKTWEQDQDLTAYNDLNDEILALLQHRLVKKGRRLSRAQTDLFILGLYNLDEFRNLLNSSKVSSLPRPMTESLAGTSIHADTALLRFAVHWLINELFGKG
jgi:Fe-S-cluster containining protein